MIKIGIVGVGGMGTVHYNNYLHLPDCAVVGLVTGSPSGREKAAAWGVPAFDTIQDLVERTGAGGGCVYPHVPAQRPCDPGAGGRGPCDRGEALRPVPGGCPGHV